ncbi:hypothetical protein TDB9533_00309 [Thalassocella blandensis]|nr:hypothetical protein TDB9533_00309 [Thalassocella blandensis]
MGIERRQYQRFNVDWPGRILLPGKEINEISIFSASRGGLGIYFVYAIPVGTQVNIEFFVRNRHVKTRIRAVTHVIHNDILAGNRGAKVGLHFQQMTSENMHALANALHEDGQPSLE